VQSSLDPLVLGHVLICTHQYGINEIYRSALEGYCYGCCLGRWRSGCHLDVSCMAFIIVPSTLHRTQYISSAMGTKTSKQRRSCMVFNSLYNNFSGLVADQSPLFACSEGKSVGHFVEIRGIFRALGNLDLGFHNGDRFCGDLLLFMIKRQNFFHSFQPGAKNSVRELFVSVGRFFY
jgi:hypothetical protein